MFKLRFQMQKVRLKCSIFLRIFSVFSWDKQFKRYFGFRIIGVKYPLLCSSKGAA